MARYFKMRKLTWILVAAVVLVGAGAGWMLRAHWLPTITADQSSLEGDGVSPAAPEPNGKPTILEISPQARKNLRLVSRPAELQNYWRTVAIPGQIADRPGVSDRGVTSPAVGVVNEIHAYPGDTIRPGETLFTLQIFSEYLQKTQSELFRATQETKLLRQQIDRLSGVARSGAVAESRLIDIRNQLTRQQTLIQAHQQDLLTRGLTRQHIEQVADGEFVSTIAIVAPPGKESASPETLAYEVQELSVELGQQVQAGQRLAELSNHRSLYVVGHAFKREATFLEQAAQERRPVEVEFVEDEGGSWPELEQTFVIRHLSGEIDPESRTFDFFIPLRNQSRSYERNGETFFVWRFRPGQRVRLHVPVEQYDNVIVIPAGGIVREGPEAYVFRQDGDLFKRIAVQVLYEDKRYAVIANDGNIALGSYLAQNSAASLNRVLKAQAASGEQPGVHVHADGTVHAAH